MNDENIIEKVNSGDAEAFAELVKNYSGMLYRICSRILCDPHEAEDAVQETFIRAWTHFYRYDRKYSLSTWFSTIACRLCYDILRKRKNRPAETLMSDPETCSDSEDRLIWKESLKELLNVTESLSLKQRTIFVLHEIEGLDHEEISRITGFTGIQIRSNLYLARKKVRNSLEHILK